MRREFWLSTAVLFLDEVLYMVIVPLLPYYAERFDMSRTESALTVAAYPILMLISSLPAGLLVDRIGSHRLLVGGTALLVLATLGFAYAETDWQLWTTRGLQGLTSGITSVAAMAVIAGGASVKRRGTTIGLAGTLSGLSLAAGPALGGYLAPAVGVQSTFLVLTGFGLLLLVGLSIPGWVETRAPRVQSPTRLLRDALRSLSVRSSMACVLVVGIVGGVAHTLGPLRLSAGGFSAGDIGTVLVIGAVLGLAATALAGILSDIRGVGVIAAVWALVVPLLVLGLAFGSTPWIAGLFLVCLVPLLRAGGSISFALGAQHAGLGAGLATGYGLLELSWSAGAIVGPIAAGAVADAWNDEAGLFIAALVALAFLPVVAAPWRRRTIPAQEATRA